MDFSHLSADTARRFGAVATLLQQHGRSIDANSPRLLDVGGHPGTFARAFVEAMPRWRATTLDKVDDKLTDYVTASGARIPFPDETFHAVTTIDTFEHVPPADRAAFLSELCRVSNKLVILAAPFHHPTVAAVERLLASSHESVFGVPHPWLDEHVQNGLPDLETTIATWPSSHAVIDVVPSYDLGEWLTWQSLSLLQKLKGEMANAWRAMEEAWAATPAPEPSEVPYRWLIVAERGGKPINLKAGFMPPENAGSGLVETARLYSRLLDLISGETTDRARMTGPMIVEQRLKDIILAQEQEILRLKSGAAGADRPITTSAIQRVGDILRRFGR
jgi:ubiquinone/menaquinone biosynthesis C-methylase UbiE